MKLLSFAFLMLTLPTLTFGATRSACYLADSVVPSHVERILCLENISDSSKVNTIDIVSADGSFPTSMKVTSVTKHNEERSRFRAEGFIHDEWNTGCGEGVSAVAVIKGNLEYGVISTTDLDINVEITSTNDTCHSEGSTEVVHYTLVK